MSDASQTNGDLAADYPGPALAMVDVAMVPPGLSALDALLKEAEVHIVAAGSVQSGRYLILFGGDVEPVQRAFGRALKAAAPHVVDSVMLPWCEERIVPAIDGGLVHWPAPGDTALSLQVSAAPSLVRAVDVALKGALVELVEFRVAEGLGGHALATLWGETHDVEAALELAEMSLANAGSVSHSARIIRRADPGVGRVLAGPSRFFKEWRG